ncbi:MAG: hypothetical protein ACOCZH_00400 [Phototrophicaceae bacterium]
MRSNYTGHVTSAEWRWVTVVAVGLVLLAFSPFLWVLLAGVTGPEQNFVGALHDHINTAGNLGRLYEGARDSWLTHYLHTPEPHPGALIDPLYALLGQVASLTSLSAIVVFHVARVGASLFMYLALYQLASTIWMRVRTRRVFFALAAFGSGFGWLLAPLTDTTSYIDLTTPGAYPFFSSLSNVHLPLAIACLALLASIIVMVVRPDDTPMPSVNNGGVMVFILSLTLVFIYPLAFLPIAAAFILNVLWRWYGKRSVDQAQFNWLLWTVVPALPMLLYYFLVMQNNVVISEIWSQQDRIAPPSVPVFLLSFGLVLLLALPGLYRGVRRFDPDADQFMMIWLVIFVLLVYLPTVAQVSFLVGFMIPLAYFATRALEDFWFGYLPRRWWVRLVVALIPLIFASNLLMLILPVQAINADNDDTAAGILIQQDYIELFRWLSSRVSLDDVILAAPDVSLWVPGWTGARVVYGHPVQTINPSAKESAVRRWYAISDDDACDTGLLDGNVHFRNADYTVNFVIYGPREAALGPAICRDALEIVAIFGDARLYRYVDGARSAN